MEKIMITRVTGADLGKLRGIGRKTFRETFSASNTEENMSEYLERGFSDTKLLAELQAPDSEFYFAESGGEVVGYLKVNFGPSQTELKGNDSLEIERIYVTQEYHGKGVAQELYKKAIAIAHEKGVQYVWLGVWEENPRAIAFYTKNGFVEFDKHIFTLGNEDQTDIMMRLKLRD